MDYTDLCIIRWPLLLKLAKEFGETSLAIWLNGDVQLDCAVFYVPSNTV